MDNRKIFDDLKKNHLEFEKAASWIMDCIDNLYNSDSDFKKIFNKEYCFNQSYNNELYKHIGFLASVILQYEYIKKNKTLNEIIKDIER